MIRNTVWAAFFLVLGACATGADGKSGRKSGTFLNRKQHGLWSYFHADGTLQAKGNYIQDRQVGRWTYWYPGGATEWEVGFAAEQFDGPSQWWWPNTQPRAYGVFSGGLEVGQFSYWNDAGTLVKQGEFDDGLAALTWTSWYDDASLKARGTLWKGQRVGLWEFWDEDGKAYAHKFAEPVGLKLHREEWEDGTPRREGFLANGKPTGRWSTRHENGVCRASGRILEGKPHGTWTVYRPDGTVLAAVKFERGNPARNIQAFAGTKAGTVSSGALQLREVEGPFSSSEEAAGRPIAEVVSTWISEAISPLAARVEYEAAKGDEPPEDLLGELSRKPALPLHAQPWTTAEEANMDFLVQLYTDGAPNMAAPAGGGQYGGGGRGQRAVRKVREGDVQRSEPLIGRKLEFAKVATRDGGTLDLHTLEGKPLVLVILRGMSGEVCVYCYTQVRALCRAMPQFKAEGAGVVVVYPGGGDRLDAFWKELSHSEELEGREAPFTFAYDPDFELVKSLSIEGNLALPTTLVLDGDGAIRFAYVGADTADRPDAKRLLEQVKELNVP